MDFDFTRMAAEDRYRLLVSFVAPRPIALVTTIARDGVANAAPMSFFNVFSQDPAIVILGLGVKPDGTPKDTMRNIRETGEFTVGMVDRKLAEAMIVTGINFPPDVDEIATAGLTLVPSRQVLPGRIAESPCTMECRLHQTIEFPQRSIVLGEVVEMHVRNECLTPDGRHVRPEAYQPIARLHADNYIVADRQFQLKRPGAVPAGVRGPRA